MLDNPNNNTCVDIPRVGSLPITPVSILHPRKLGSILSQHWLALSFHTCSIEPCSEQTAESSPPSPRNCLYLRYHPTHAHMYFQSWSYSLKSEAIEVILWII